MKAVLALIALAALAVSPGFGWGSETGEVASEAELSQGVDGEHSGADHGDGHEGDHSSGDHSGGAGTPVDFSPDLAWFTLAVFIALAVLLRVFAWDPIIKALQAREDGIASDIESAASKHEEAKALLAEHQAKIASATDDVRAMLDEARRDAERTKAQIVDEARQAADAEKKRVIREVEQARDSAIKHMAEESASLAIDLAAKVVKQDISADRQGEIVREAIGRMADAQPSEN